MKADALYNVIIETNIAIQKLLSFVVSKHAIEHPDAHSHDANEAFSDVLLKHLPVFKEKVKLIKTEANRLKIFQANSVNLLPSIDICSLDSCFLLDILLKVEEFFDFTSIDGNCINTQCQGQCCSICNHASAVCKKCTSNSGKPTKRCHHQCSHCNTSEEECDDYSEICCLSCQLCKHCNKDALTIKEKSIINNISGPLTVYPCVLTEYQKSLEILLCFRNLFGHCLKSDCEGFLKGTQVIGDFKKIHNYKELTQYITYAFGVVLGYTNDPKIYTKSPNLMLDKVEMLEDLECIFQCGKPLQSHLNDIDKFKEIFQVGADVIKEIENFKSKLQETIEENHGCIRDHLHGIEKILQENFQTDGNKNFNQMEKKLQLEKNCGSFCIFRVDHQVSEDDIQSLVYAEVEEEDKEDQEVQQWRNLHYKLISEDNFGYIISDNCLKSGYLYSFKLELKDSEVLTYRKLSAIADSDWRNKKTRHSKIILIAYNDGKESNVHMQKLGKQIEGKTEIKNTILGGANVPATNVEEFKKICQEFYQRSSYLKRFPPGYLQQQYTSRIDDMFQQLSEHSGNFNIICGPQFVKQLELFGFSAKDLNTLQIEDVKTTEQDILVTNFSQMLIMIICVSESENVHKIKHDVNRCNGIVKALRILHEESLTNTFAAVCGIVACPRIARQSLKNESHVYNDEDISLFLAADDLRDIDCLERWWEEAIQDTVSDERKHYGVETSEESTERWRSAYESIVGETMATMSIVDMTLPRLSSDLNTQVTSLLLNIEQQDAISKGSCIVNGPFGSGKSLVLKEIARRLSRCHENSSIYFVCLDPYSLLEVDAVKYLDSLEKRKDKSKKVKLYNMRHLVEKAKEAVIDIHDLPNIIDYICKAEQQPTSFLFDEMNGDTFTKDHANRLKDLVDNKNNLRELVLAPQSIQKDREVHHNGQKTPLTKNQFQQTGLKNVELPKRMRMTAKINNVIQVAEECVKRIETTFKIPDSSKKNFTSDEDFGSNLSTTNNLNDEEISNNLDDKIKIPSNVSGITERIAQLKMPEKKDTMLESGEVSEHSEKNKQHNNNNKIKKKDVCFDAEEYLDTDDVLEKLQSDLHVDFSFRSVRNIYRYQSGDIGHTVKGRKPQLIFLDYNFDIDSAKSGNVLSCVLEMACLRDGKHTTIVCSSKSEAILVCYALKRSKQKYRPYFHHLLEEPPPSYEEKEKLWGELKRNVILVTDYRGFRGCETEHCITFINQESVYKSHILVEVLARAVAHIDILVLPIQANSNDGQKGSVNTNEATLADVIDEWKRPKDDGECIVEVFNVSVAEKAGKFELKVNEVVKLVEVTSNDQNVFQNVKEEYRSGDVLSKKQCDQFLEKSIMSHIAATEELNPSGDADNPSGDADNLSGDVDNPSDDAGNPSDDAGNSSCDAGNPSGDAVKVVNSRDLEKLSELKNWTKKRYEHVCVTFERSGLHLPIANKRKDIVVGLSLIKDAEKAFFQAADSYIAEEEISKQLEMGIYRHTHNIIQKMRSELEEVSSQQSDYNDIMTSPNDYVVISGAPGCGKTTLCETLAYNWACEKIWVDNPSFKFVFILKFRELNRFKNSQNVTAEGILSHFYPAHFNEKATTLKSNSLLILDGFDECFNKYDLLETESEFTNYIRALYDLLDPYNTKLPSARLVTSRPASCSVLFSLLKSKQCQLRLFEVTGFSMENVKKYVMHYYQQTSYSSDVQQKKLNKFLAEVEQSPILRSLMTIPFYCNGVCCLMLESEIDIESIPLTYTGLFTTLLTLFLRNHGLRNSKLGLTEVLKIETTKPMILMLSKFAFSMEMKRKITFTKSDFQEGFYYHTNIEKLLERTGLILKLDHGDEPFYQFVHYSFHEFLVALHLFHIGSTKPSRNPYILSMVGGLTGGLVGASKSTYLFVKHYARMFRPRKPIDIEVLLRRHNDISQFLAIVFEYQNELHLKKHTIVCMSSTRGNIYPQEHHVQHFIKSSSEGHIVIDSVLIKTDLSCLRTHGEILVAFTQSALFKVLFVNGSYHPEENQGVVGLSYKNSYFDKLISLEDTLIIAKFLDIASLTNDLEFIEYFDYDSVKDDIFKLPVGNVNLTIHMKISEFVEKNSSSRTKFEHYCKLFKSVTVTLYTEKEQRYGHHLHDSNCFPAEFIGEVKHAIAGNHHQLHNLNFAASCTLGVVDGVVPSIRKI